MLKVKTDNNESFKRVLEDYREDSPSINYLQLECAFLFINRDKDNYTELNEEIERLVKVIEHIPIKPNSIIGYENLIQIIWSADRYNICLTEEANKVLDGEFNQYVKRFFSDLDTGSTGFTYHYEDLPSNVLQMEFNPHFSCEYFSSTEYIVMDMKKSDLVFLKY